MAQDPNPHAGPDVLEIAWDILASSPPRTRRVCRHCGTPAAVAMAQNEPICNQGGLVGGHSYLDLPVAS